MANCRAKGHANSLLLACSEPHHISRNEHPELTHHKPKKVCGVGCLRDANGQGIELIKTSPAAARQSSCSASMRRGGSRRISQAAGVVAEGLARGKRLPAARFRRLLALVFDVCLASQLTDHLVNIAGENPLQRLLVI